MEVFNSSQSRLMHGNTICSGISGSGWLLVYLILCIQVSNFFSGIESMYIYIHYLNTSDGTTPCIYRIAQNSDPSSGSGNLYTQYIRHTSLIKMQFFNLHFYDNRKLFSDTFIKAFFQMKS